jgi:hypothetical protein
VTREVVLALWAALAAATMALVFAPAVSSGRVATPRRVLAWASGSGVRLVLLTLGWMWLGWHLFAR